MAISGSGTQADPWIVTTYAELVTKAVSDGYIKIGNDINITDEYPDGDMPTLSMGDCDIDGNIKTISNWYRNTSGYCIANTDSTDTLCNIHDLTLKNIYIDGSATAFCNRAEDNNSRPFFENCHYTYRNLDNPSQNFEHPAVLDFLDVDMEFIQGEVAHPELAQYLRNCIEQEHESLTIAICTNDSPKNIALAIYMPRQVFEAKVPIWVYQNGDNSMNAFVENDDTDNLYSSIRVFSPVNYGISDRKNSWQWQLAKNVSDDYAQRHPYDDNYRWEFSQPSIRWSSLYGAISKITMLRSIGKVSTPILLTKEEEQEMALTEHNRWNTEKLLNGWEPTSSGKKTMFVHNKIVPYEQLDENSKEKDKEQIEVVRKKLNLDGKM